LVATTIQGVDLRQACERPNTRVQSCRCFFRISHGRYSGASDLASEFESREAAWTEMNQVCANLVDRISRSLKQDAECQMELLDEAKKPVFRTRLVAESFC
jgi:hypothetical protein